MASGMTKRLSASPCPGSALSGVDKNIGWQGHAHDQLGDTAKGVLIQYAELYGKNAKNNQDQKDPNLV